MRTYLLHAAAEFRRFSTYRLAIFAGVVTQSVFGFIQVSVPFAAIAAAGGTLAGRFLVNLCDREPRAGEGEYQSSLRRVEPAEDRNISH